MAKGKVLLVEDDLNTCEMLSALLKLRGFEVKTAADGARALEILENLRPDVIVTDMKMPVIEGEQLIRAIREKELLANVPVVVLTGFKKESVEAAFAAGATEVLEKPMGVTQLVATIKHLLGHD